MARIAWALVWFALAPIASAGLPPAEPTFWAQASSPTALAVPGTAIRVPVVFAWSCSQAELQGNPRDWPYQRANTSVVSEPWMVASLGHGWDLVPFLSPEDCDEARRHEYPVELLVVPRTSAPAHVPSPITVFLNVTQNGALGQEWRWPARVTVNITPAVHHHVSAFSNHRVQTVARGATNLDILVWNYSNSPALVSLDSPDLPQGAALVLPAPFSVPGSRTAANASHPARAGFRTVTAVLDTRAMDPGPSTFGIYLNSNSTVATNVPGQRFALDFAITVEGDSPAYVPWPGWFALAVGATWAMRRRRRRKSS